MLDRWKTKVRNNGKEEDKETNDIIILQKDETILKNSLNYKNSLDSMPFNETTS